MPRPAPSGRTWSRRRRPWARPGGVARGIAPEPVGFDGPRAPYESAWAAIPDATIAIEDFLIGMDRPAIRFAIAGGHDGPFAGVPVAGREARFEGQLGALPAPT